jgi:hypothetical protein
MIKSIAGNFTSTVDKSTVNATAKTVPLAVFTRFADEVARIARTSEMSPAARQQLCDELETTYAVITNKEGSNALLYA